MVVVVVVVVVVLLVVVVVELRVGDEYVSYLYFIYIYIYVNRKQKEKQFFTERGDVLYPPKNDSSYRRKCQKMSEWCHFKVLF